LNPKSNSYIRIKTIDDLDPNKFSINQIQQRFIDGNKQKYGLRFNKDTRRIEILKLLPNGEFEVVLREKDSDTPRPKLEMNLDAYDVPLPESSPNEPVPQSPSVSPVGEEIVEEPKEPLVHEGLDLDISNTSLPSKPIPRAIPRSKKLGTPKELPSDTIAEQFLDILHGFDARVDYILKNLRESQIFEATGDPSENQDIVGNFRREYDFHVGKEIKDALKIHEEILSNPRPLIFYLSKITTDQKNEIESIEDEKQKFFALHSIEMKKTIPKCFQITKIFVSQLLSIFNLKSESQIRQLQFLNQELYRDSKNAVIFFTQELDKVMVDVKNWIES